MNEKRLVKRRKPAKKTEAKAAAEPLEESPTATDASTTHLVETAEETLKTEPFTCQVWCHTCRVYKKASAMQVDANGMFQFNLECGHKEAFAFKVELDGYRALAIFRK